MPLSTQQSLPKNKPVSEMRPILKNSQLEAQNDHNDVFFFLFGGLAAILVGAAAIGIGIIAIKEVGPLPYKITIFFLLFILSSNILTKMLLYLLR